MFKNPKFTKMFRLVLTMETSFCFELVDFLN